LQQLNYRFGQMKFEESVIPAQAGIQSNSRTQKRFYALCEATPLDSGLRRNDEIKIFLC